MSKLTHDWRAFAKRVLMGSTDLWLVVEGRDHDRTHYERLLRALPATRNKSVSVRLAEQLTVDGSAAGGKAHALALHDLLDSEGALSQRNRDAEPKIVFMLDRDRDDLAGLASTSAHVIYTNATDVEADILLNADLWGAVEAAYGITSEATEILKAATSDPSEALLALWRDWVLLGLVVVACNARHVMAFMQESCVNSQKWGPVDEGLLSAWRAKLESLATPEEMAEASRVATVHFGDRGTALLKGRWLSAYLGHLVRTQLRDEVIRVNVRDRSVIDIALVSLDYTGPWTDTYQTRFSELLAS